MDYDIVMGKGGVRHSLGVFIVNFLPSFFLHA